MPAHLAQLARLWLATGVLGASVLLPSHVARAGGGPTPGACQSLLTVSGHGTLRCVLLAGLDAAERLFPPGFRPVSPVGPVAALLHLRLLQADLLFDPYLWASDAHGVYPPFAIAYVFGRYPADACPPRAGEAGVVIWESVRREAPLAGIVINYRSSDLQDCVLSLIASLPRRRLEVNVETNAGLPAARALYRALAQAAARR